MKRFLKLALGLLIAYLVYRLVTEYLRLMRVPLDEPLESVSPYRESPPTSIPEPEPSPPPAIEADRIDLNRADAKALISLPGIGPRLAERIIAYRQQAGSFVDLDHLTKVQGIGPSLVEQLRALVTLS